MNDATHDAYQAYLRDLANRLRLTDWVVELHRNTAEAGSWASVNVMGTQDTATVRLAWPDPLPIEPLPGPVDADVVVYDGTSPRGR